MVLRVQLRVERRVKRGAEKGVRGGSGGGIVLLGGFGGVGGARNVGRGLARGGGRRGRGVDFIGMRIGGLGGIFGVVRGGW